MSFYLSDEEKKALDQIRGKLSYREYVMRGVVDPRPKGRPSLDAATRDLEDQHRQRDEDNRKQVHDELLEANRRGLDPRTSLRMLGDQSEWNEIICSNCQNTYFTKSKTESKCWRCSVINKTPRTPQVYELQAEQPVAPKEEEVKSFEEKRTGNLTTGWEDPRKDDLVEEEGQGNLTNVTLSERARKRFNISMEEWLALTEAEREYYISLLPPARPDSLNQSVIGWDLSRFKFPRRKREG